MPTERRPMTATVRGVPLDAPPALEATVTRHSPRAARWGGSLRQSTKDGAPLRPVVKSYHARRRKGHVHESPVRHVTGSGGQGSGGSHGDGGGVGAKGSTGRWAIAWHGRGRRGE